MGRVNDSEVNDSEAFWPNLLYLFNRHPLGYWRFILDFDEIYVGGVEKSPDSDGFYGLAHVKRQNCSIQSEFNDS